MARLGIGNFSIADGDEYEVANFNRQAGASINTVGRGKAEVMAEQALAINPNANVRRWDEKITGDNVDSFLDGVDVLVDGVDFWAFDARRMLFRAARERGIWVVTAGPIGFSTAWLLFDPKGMTFEDYFDLRSDLTPTEQFVAYALGLAPQMTQRPYLDMSCIDGDAARGPSAALACQLAAGVVGAEVVKILLGRGQLRPVPFYAQFDAYRGILRQGRLFWGNRGPVQRIKRQVMRKLVEKLGY